ncbi:hypothetical protein HanPI659440_Chr01g0000041 [Helianthus annuus]|nr:hypothetical protein HanPI659440_Chr01g0000041 [Helianthus annuus]
MSDLYNLLSTQLGYDLLKHFKTVQHMNTHQSNCLERSLISSYSESCFCLIF